MRFGGIASEISILDSDLGGDILEVSSVRLMLSSAAGTDIHGTL